MYDNQLFTQSCLATGIQRYMDLMTSTLLLWLGVKYYGTDEESIGDGSFSKLIVWEVKSCVLKLITF